MKIDTIKRRYFDMRTGNVTVSPILQLGNFLMLSYLTINEIIPIYLFAPIFIVTILATFTVIGNKFRKHQTTTDINLMYEKSTKAGGTVFQMMSRLDEIAKHTGTPENKDFAEWKQYMKDIGDAKL